MNSDSVQEETDPQQVEETFPFEVWSNILSELKSTANPVQNAGVSAYSGAAIPTGIATSRRASTIPVCSSSRVTRSSSREQQQLVTSSSEGRSSNEDQETAVNYYLYFNGTEIRNMLVVIVLLYVGRLLFEAVTSGD